MSVESNSANQKLSCCVTLCKNYLNTRSNTELYPLPADWSFKKIFCDTLGIPIEVAGRRDARVCALHFNSKNPEKKNIQTTTQNILKVIILL